MTVSGLALWRPYILCNFVLLLGPCGKPIYPSGFDPDSCLSFLRQWTYNPKAGQCVEINYHSCGEDRQGYNVFDEEGECINTCVHRGIVFS